MADAVDMLLYTSFWKGEQMTVKEIYMYIYIPLLINWN